MTAADGTEQVLAERPGATGTTAGYPVPDRPGLYSLLLRLAGRVPDDDLAEMRTCLADGEESELASLLATAVGTGTLALTDAEAALVRALLAESHIDPGSADRAPRIEHLPSSRYRFAGQSGVEASETTGLPSNVPRGAREATDAVVMEAGDRVGGLIGLWRVFRYSGEGVAHRVYLGEAESTADVAELAAEMQHALADAGEDTPRVEVFHEGAALTPYHDAALAAAALVWAAAAAPVRLTRVFDGADPEGGPFFHPDHPRLEGPDGDRVLAYLRAGELVLNTPGAMDDVLDAGRVAAVPVGFRSDGRWVWPDAVAYYLKRHHLAPEPELIAHMLAASSPPRPLNRLGRHRALVALSAPTGGEPVWQAG